jgi:prolyl oligopeptidase
MRSCLLVVGLVAACSRPTPGARLAAERTAPPQPQPPTAVAGRQTSPTPLPAPPPAASLRARTVEVTETRFGLTVSDPYRWMEGDANPEATAWIAAQGDQARDYLARLPGRETLLARIRELGNATGSISRVRQAGDKVFYFRTAPGEQLAKIMVREGGKVRVLADPAAFESAGGHASIDSFSPSPDGTKLAFNVSGGGAEVARTHVREVATGKDLPDRVERLFGGSAVTWLPDGSGFLYTQKAAPAPGIDQMLNAQVRLHVLATPSDQDVSVLGPGLTSIVIAPNELTVVTVSRGSRWVVAEVAGARSDARYLVAPLAALDRSGAGKTPWRTVSEYADGGQAAVVHGDRLYLLTHKAASNRQIVSVAVANPDLATARVEVPEDPRASITRMAAARDALYIQQMVNGRARLLRWPWRGEPTAIALPFDGWIGQLESEATRDGVMFGEQGWTRPLAYYAYDPARTTVAAAALATTSNADFTDIVANEVEAVSSDGTRVPLSILHRKDITRDGARPSIVQGYAGYAVSETPAFSPTSLAWLERGNVIAVCHGRGGGEKGQAWYEGGARENKMNGVHDFEACAQALVDARLSSPGHLFAQGGSMGGVLIGRAITDRPELFAAANIAVGMVNPLRLVVAKNGSTQFAEVGDPETEAGFRALHAMDPYQHVVSASYPATMFTIGLNDARVSPWMSGKMAARLQAMTTSGKPILIRVDKDAGHGMGSTRDQAFAERADVWSFFLAASGDPAFVPR